MADFDINETIQSQYAASPHIVKLVNSFWDALNPEADIKSIYDNMVNPDTAIGFGLDVWGRIVAVGRELLAVDEESKYFGFHAQGDRYNRITGYDQAPFFKERTGKVRLSDSAYRTYIFIKAMINIGDSTLASLNNMVKTMFPDVNICVIHVDTMALRVVIKGYMREADKTALLKLPWLPAGVKLEIYQIITPTFGFLGQELDNFDNGTFGWTEPHIYNA